MNKIIVLPDIHCPNYDDKSVDAVLNFIKFYKPTTLIQLGDFCDWDSVSTYDPHSENDIQPFDQEVNSSNLLLDEIDHAVGKKCRKVMLGGNHEDRYQKFLVNRGMMVDFRRMRSLTSWDEEYNLNKRGWEHKDYGDHITIGKAVFTHGWYASANAAARMAACFPGRNVIFGHTHQHLIYGCMDERDLPIESESIGTLSKFNLSYLRGKPPVNWLHGFMFIDMRDNGLFSKHFVNIIDGAFIEYGREFTNQMTGARK